MERITRYYGETSSHIKKISKATGTVPDLSLYLLDAPLSEPFQIPAASELPLSLSLSVKCEAHRRRNIILLQNTTMALPSTDSKTSPNSVHYPGVDGKEMTALQKHVAFFDRNKDGVIYPSETFEGFRAIGSGLVLSAFASVFIHLGLSSKTRTGKFSFRFPIFVNNINKAKHGSDTGVYDTEGRFVSAKFEEVFHKHARSNANALTSDELGALLKANREPKDVGGWIGAYSEWKILYLLCKDKNGLLHKDTVRAVYDGSLFESMAKEKASSKKQSVSSV